MPGYAGVSRDPVGHDVDALGVEGPCMLVECSCSLLPSPLVQVRRFSDGCLQITEDCHFRDEVCSQCLRSYNELPKCDSDHP